MLLRTGNEQGTSKSQQNKKEPICTDEVELFLALQLVTLRHWSSHQPSNWDGEHLCRQHFCATEALGANSEDVSIRWSNHLHLHRGWS